MWLARFPRLTKVCKQPATGHLMRGVSRSCASSSYTRGCRGLPEGPVISAAGTRLPSESCSRRGSVKWSLSGMPVQVDLPALNCASREPAVLLPTVLSLDGHMEALHNYLAVIQFGHCRRFRKPIWRHSLSESPVLEHMLRN